MIADRMKCIDASGIRKVFDLAAKMKDPINLSIGQPDFDVPHAVKEAAISAIRAGRNKYTVTQGIAELHDALRAQLTKEQRLRNHEGDDIMVSSGTSGALMLALLTLVNAGDEVLIADPYFVMYKHLVNLLGAVPVFVDTYPDFALTAERVERCLTKRTKLLIVNSPCNPTGAVGAARDLEEIAALCNPRGIWVLTDEIYRTFCYDGPHASIFPQLERGLLIDGFSKSHAMTGWRIGYAVGPARLIQEMNKLQQYTFVHAPSIAQHAAVIALQCDMTPLLHAYRRKRDLIYNGLKDAFACIKPGGAFYLFVKAPGKSATHFVEQAIARQLLVIPGNVFSERDTHFRISYAAPDETITRGIAVLRSLA